MRAREQRILSAGLGHLERILEDGGLGRGERDSRGTGELDAVYCLPGRDVRFLIEVKQSLQPYQLAKLAERAEQYERQSKLSGHDSLLLMVPRVPQSVLLMCEELGLLVLDEEANGHLKVPGLYYHRYAPSKKDVSSGVRRNSAFSSKASRLVRAILAEYPRRWRQVELAEQTAVTAGYVSKVVNQMLKEDYLRRDRDRLRVVNADRLLDDWSASNRFDRHRRSRFAIAMGEYQQGLRKFQQEMRRQDIRFVFTGWSAAYLRSPYGIPDSIVAYVDRMPENVARKALHPVESKGNVLLLLPHDEGVFQFSQPGEFGDCVADAQCYVDLLGMPGRAPDQAQAMREKLLKFEDRDNA
jgi:hypothetical protein